MSRYFFAAAAAAVLAWTPVPGFGGAGPLHAQQQGQAGAELPDSAEVRRLVEERLGPGVTPAEVLDYIRESGLTRAEVRSRLRRLGYNPALADRYFDWLERGGELPGGQVPPELAAVLGLMDTGAEQDSTGARAPLADSLRADSLKRGLAAAEDDSIFGQNLFVLPTSQFQPVLLGPAPPDYRLGPGDWLRLVLTGDVEMIYETQVSREGYLVIPDVGQVIVNGLTMAELEDRLYERLGRVYSSVRRGPEATTHFQISLGTLRTNQIYVIGEVRQPGAYSVSAMATVFDALYRAMGPNDIGSLRRIQVRRNGQVVAEVDLYDYLLTGDSRSDIRLEHGDIVFVPVTGPRVRVEGAVHRPKIYELTPTDGVGDLIEFAGGFQADALVRRVQIDRILAPSERRPGVDRVLLDVDLEMFREEGGEPIALRDGDQVRVFGVDDERRHRITLTGEVERPGLYEWSDGMTLRDLLANAGGLDEAAYRPRVHVYRLDAVDGGRLLLRTPLLAGAGSAAARDVPLADRDSVVVYSRAALKTPDYVTIDGFVKNPGTYPLAEGMSAKDLILAAGGFTEGAYVVEAEVTRRTDPLERTDATAEVIRLPLAEAPRLDAGAAGGGGTAMLRYASETGGGMAGDAAPAAAGAVAEAASDVPEWLPSAEEFDLRHGDRVVVRKAPGYEPARLVEVTGEVALPGTYVLRTRSETLADVLERAGGFASEAYPPGVRLIRDSMLVATEVERALMDPESRHNLVLEAGDSIHVPAYDATVMVRGAVTYESRVLYRPGAGLDYYVEQAGGYMEASDRERVAVTYQNGERQLVREFLFFDLKPELQPGSTIFVPEKPEAEMGGVDWDQLITRTVQIATSALTALLLVERLGNDGGS